MPLFRVDSADDPRLADYRLVPEPGLLRRRGLFVAENRLVVRTLLASRFVTRSVLVTGAAYDSLRDVLEPAIEGAVAGRRPHPLDVYVVPKSLMEPVAGYAIHRGCLAIGERPEPVNLERLLPAIPGARLLVVLEAMTNADNVGAIFRNARAFAADAVVVGPRCCDPLYRKAIRVSIGATLTVPFATTGTWDPASAGYPPLAALRRAGFTLVGLTPAPDAIDLDEFAAAPLPPRAALVVGNEGEGLSRETLEACDVRVRIAMAPGVDSLNASTAAGIALHRLYREP